MCLDDRLAGYVDCDPDVVDGLEPGEVNVSCAVHPWARRRGASLVGLSVLIMRRYAQICADHDLTPAQAQLLCMIRDQPRGMTQLAKIMDLAKNGLSGLVDRAERRGLVRRETPDHDRRAVTLSLTRLGEEAVDALYSGVNKRIPDILDTLPSEARGAAEQTLASLAAASGVPLLFGGVDPSRATERQDR